MNLGYRLKLLLQEKQITQKQLSQNLHIAQSTLNGYINGYREPDFKMLDTLACYFDVSVDYLLGRCNSTTKDNEILNSDETELIHLYRQMSNSQRYFTMEQAKIYVNYNKKEMLP